MNYCHHYERGEMTRPMHTDPMCAVCGQPQRSAVHRDEEDPCERGTVGCAVHHTGERNEGCDTW